MLKRVTFNTSSTMAEDTYAETSRNISEDTDDTININPRFKEQIEKEDNTSDENNRVWFVLAVTIVHELCHLFLRRHGIKYTPGSSQVKSWLDPHAGEQKFRGRFESRLEAVRDECYCCFAEKWKFNEKD